MKKKEYLKKIKKILQNNKVDKSEEIVADINELYDAKMSEGKNASEIILSMGEPEDVAKQYMDDHSFKNNKNGSKIKKIFICICSIFALGFIVSSILIGTGIIDIDQTKQYNNQIVTSVYLESAETKFKTDTNHISITLKNVAKVKFEDIFIRLIYLNNAEEAVGVEYSEQKIVSLDADSTNTIIFSNPGWTYAEYNEIYACVRDQNSVST